MENSFTLKKLTPQILAQIPFFKEMEMGDLEMFSEKMRVLNMDKGSLIISEGDEGKKIYFIIQGTVTVFRKNYKGQIEYIYELNAPGYFGEMAIMDGGPRSASIEAKTNTVLAELKWDDLKYLLKDKPEIMCDVFKNIGNVISMRLRRTNSLNSCLVRA